VSEVTDRSKELLIGQEGVPSFSVELHSTHHGYWGVRQESDVAMTTKKRTMLKSKIILFMIWTPIHKFKNGPDVQIIIGREH
jgi:hypothetical protein